ncbi:unnamed protein product [Clonostachys solani]|uniref:Uncharacterized protein n=1 Tax=Clonostachys solani TaxID=160281 RepID=A0A9N9Z7D9_9HYPO|nr:unnamed protein product [Clonostachys solani]
MASPQLRRSARISARREAISLGTILASPESPQPPLQEPATPIAQDIPEADSSSSDQFHAPGSDASYHRNLWRKAFKISLICFQVAMLARIVLFVGQRLPRGAYHEISLINDLINAAITQSVLSHILTYHDLQPLLAAQKSFQLPIHDSVLEYARYQQRSSLLPTGSPWLFSPVPRRYLINTTEHDYAENIFDMVPWVSFHEDLAKVLETTADDLAWFAKDASTSDLFKEAVNSERRATNSKSTDRISDFQFCEPGTDGSLKMDEAFPWSSVSQSVPCETQDIRFNSLLYDLNQTVRTAVDYWLRSKNSPLYWGAWHLGARDYLSGKNSGYG